MADPELLHDEPYHIPERFNSMTMNTLSLLAKGDELENNPTVDQYFSAFGFALLADLSQAGIGKEDIEAAVNKDRISYAHWPLEEPSTDFYWSETPEKLAELEDLARQAVKFCYGQTPVEPVGGFFTSVGGEMGSQQLALAGLIYARERGDLHEIPNPDGDDGRGPIYIVRDSYAGRTIESIYPEDSSQ